MKSSNLRTLTVLLGFIIACILGIFGAFDFIGGRLLKLIIPGLFLLVVLPPIGVCIMAFGVKTFLKTWIKAFSMMLSTEATPLTSSECVIIQTASTVAYLGAAIGTIFGFVITMSYLTAGKDVIGEHMASSLISLFYAMLFDGIIVQSILRRNDWLSGESNQEDKTQPRIWLTKLLVILCILSFVFGFTFLTFWLLSYDEPVRPVIGEKEAEIQPTKKVPDFLLNDMETIVGNTKGKQHLLFSMYFDAPPAARENLEKHRVQMVHEVNLLGAQIKPEDLKDSSKLRFILAEGAKAIANKNLGLDEVKNVYLLDLVPIVEGRFSHRDESNLNPGNNPKEFILSEMTTPLAGVEIGHYLVTSIYFDVSPESVAKLEANRAQLIHQAENILANVKERELDDPAKLQLFLSTELAKPANEILAGERVRNVYLLDLKTVTRAHIDDEERDRDRLFNRLEKMLRVREY